MAYDFYFAPLGGSIKNAFGLYEHGTGRCVYYSDGGQWFFEMGTGKPSFYVSEGVLYDPVGKPLRLNVDTAPLKGAKS